MKKTTEKTETTKSTRIITKYLKQRGIDLVLQECGNNLRAFKSHLKKVCNLDKSVKLYDIVKQAKEILKTRLDEYKVVDKAVDKFLRDNFGGNNNEQNNIF